MRLLTYFAMLLPFAGQLSRENHLPRQAHGTFTVKLQPLPPPVDAIARMSIDKSFEGGLEGTSRGEMLSSGDAKAGAAGYVAMETVTGKLGGQSGSFALQHFGTIGADGQQLQILVVPGSGTGALEGLTGTFTLTVANGQHRYDLEYTLPGT